MTDLLAERRELARWLLFGNAIATAILAFAGWIVVARLRRPVAGLVGAIEESRRAPRPIPQTEIPTGDPGFARLIQTYNRMTSDVERRAEAERGLAERARIDDFLTETVALMEARGLRLSGTVRASPVDHHAHPCHMDVRVLPDGPLNRISEALGSESRGCRLDPAAIEQVASDVEARIERSDLLAINKFGKQESLGRGLRPASAKAVELGIPVLVGVNGLNLPGFMTFTSGMAMRLKAEPAAALAWSLESIEAVRSLMV